MNSPKISIVIPSYNKVKYIGKTLESIASQNYKNFEVIIQDGGSTDGTLKIIEKYSKKYPRHIRYVSKKDNGQLDAINSGVQKANGDIITFINADDIYTPRTFESVSACYSENPNSLWFAGKSIVIDEKGREIAKIATIYKSFQLKLNSYKFLLSNNYLMQPAVFLKNDAFKKYGLFSGNKFAVMEYEMWLKIGKDQMPTIVNKTLTKFRLEKDTKTSLNSSSLLAEDLKIVSKYTNNRLILFLHKLNNVMRVVMINLLTMKLVKK